MSFPAYERYKESGRDWLGVVPDHWRRVPFWSLFRRTKRAGFPDAELLSVYRDYGVIRKADRDDNFNNASEDLSTYQLVEPGDLAMNKMKAWQGSLGVSAHRGIVSPAYFVFQAQHAEDPSFLHYLLRSSGYAVGFMTISKGIRIGQWDLDPDHLGTVPIPLPPVSEQQAIAAFLDGETAKIDALVEAQRRLIELLKEKRQAVISHAVIKGLEPSAPMKDSGVEWLGQVPAHWELVPIKRVTKTIEQGWSPQCENYPVQSRDEWGVLKVGCVNGGRFSPDENKTLPAELEPVPELGISRGDLLVSRANTRELVGSAAVAEDAYPNLLLCDKLYRLRLDPDRCRPALLALFLGCREARSQIERAATGASSSMLNIGQAVVLELPLPLPPSDEQTEILDWLESELGKIDSLTVEAQAATAILQERRAALISAAVTGKIDVRGRAASVQEADAA